MGDAITAGRKVTLGGKERVLVLDFNALATADEITGKDYLRSETWFREVPNGDKPSVVSALTARDYRALVYGCLHGSDPTVTLEQVGSWMSPTDEATGEAMVAVMDLWMGEAKKPVEEGGETTKDTPFVNAGSDGGR